MSLEDRAEELASDLGQDKEEVEQALENLVQYSVPLDEAVQSVRRKYGGDSGGGGEPTRTDIGDVTTETSGNVTVDARVLTVGERSIYYNDELQVIREGELGDETGKIQFTDWHGFDLSPGDSITAGNCSVREFQGKPQLSIGESTTIGFRDETVETPYRVGGDRTLAELETGDGAINVEVQVVEVETRQVSGRGDEPKPILSGVVADGSGRLPFTDWEPADHAGIEQGASIRIENAHVKEFRGVPQVTLTEHSRVEALDTAVEVAEEAPRMTVSEAVDSGGVFDVEVTGSLLGVRDGSGLIQRCPECNRIIQKGQCRSHGQVDGYYDLRVKAILDDGTSALTVVLDDELTERVYGGDVEDAQAHAQDAMDTEVVAERIADNLVGKEYRVRGDLSVDDYGANLDATEFEELEEDPTEQARAFLTEVDA
ncbi:Single-stranded DNA binding protein [Salinirubellus salinus]|uniref:Single-stranded DNA binding protein n=1 Tax=Salinirubellus salinus TaxID=1364945 RepID=A0A9E7R6V3_9EURY|nr:Single-stranded DNA binding protein [Salinirubellus salinus]UWM55765.1 Single-stranded DNA binding protein [Salinirubellus salinus]